MHGLELRAFDLGNILMAKGLMQLATAGVMPDALVAHIEAICRNTMREFAGALLRPHGPVVKPMMDIGNPPKDIFEAARDAGRQLVQRGSIEPGTLETVARDLLPREQYLEIANQMFRKALEKAGQAPRA